MLDKQNLLARENLRSGADGGLEAGSGADGEGHLLGG
jgi:hypothetical protein